MSNFFSTREVADLLGTQTWKVRRLFESGELLELGRFAGKRAIPSNRIPEIVDVLRRHGWLEAEAVA
jgi:hypothetical protein